MSEAHDREPRPDDREATKPAGAGSDPGRAYERAVAEGEVRPPQDDEPDGPSVADVHRSGS